jgi:hypothetical protein
MSYGYYNTGILLLNLALWRNGKLGEECVDFLLKNPEKCTYVDQDAINYCLRGKIKQLPFRYNCLSYAFVTDIHAILIAAAFHDALREAVKHPAIVHLVGSPKSWHADFHLAFNSLKPLQDIWLYCKSQTPWKEERLVYCFPPPPGLGAALKRAIRRILTAILTAVHVLHPPVGGFYMPPPPALVEQCAALLSRLKAL